MRLWTLHPRYLDARGLTALWREALLAQEVLRGRTSGYRHHPQLERFRALPRPAASVARYLIAVHDESRTRGYRFDRTKIGRPAAGVRVPETREQLLYEWAHLLRKLRGRSPTRYRELRRVEMPDAHPMFRIGRGGERPWERPRAAARPATRRQVRP